MHFWMPVVESCRASASSGTLQRAGSTAALMGSNHEMTLRAKRELGEKHFMQFAL